MIKKISITGAELLDSAATDGMAEVWRRNWNPPLEEVYLPTIEITELSGNGKKLEINTSRQFILWLAEQNLSLAFTIYQTAKIPPLTNYFK